MDILFPCLCYLAYRNKKNKVSGERENIKNNCLLCVHFYMMAACPASLLMCEMLEHIAELSIEKTCTLALLAMTCKDWRSWLRTSKRPTDDQWRLYTIIWRVELHYDGNINHHPLRDDRDMRAILRADRPDLIERAWAKCYPVLISGIHMYWAIEYTAIRFMDWGYTTRRSLLPRDPRSWIEKAVKLGNRDMVQWALDHHLSFGLDPCLTRMAADANQFDMVEWLITADLCTYNKERLMNIAIEYDNVKALSFLLTLK